MKKLAIITAVTIALWALPAVVPAACPDQTWRCYNPDTKREVGTVEVGACYTGLLACKLCSGQSGVPARRCNENIRACKTASPAADKTGGGGSGPGGCWGCKDNTDGITECLDTNGNRRYW